MNICKSYIISKNGEEFSTSKYCRIEEVDGVNAVYFEGEIDEDIDRELGAVIEIDDLNISKWMADWRKIEFWCVPAFGTEVSDIPNQTQCLLYQNKSEKYGVILPVVSENYKCVLEGNPKGKLESRLYTWMDGFKEVKALAFVFAEGDNPYALIENCVSVAVKLLGNNCKIRKDREYPEIFKYLGWCSWDAFQIRVSEEDLISKCEEFKKKEIPVKWAILDDMWAEVRDFYDAPYETREEMFKLMHSSKLYSFKADPRRFPNGLKTCIHKMNEYGISVGMWHPTTGCWSGIDENGDIFKEYKDLLIKTENGMYIPSYEEEKAYKYYVAFHDYLKDCGTEFVKIDNQSMTRRFYQKLDSVGSVSRQFHNAMEKSVKEHFESRMINCMGMASEDMWNRSLSPISRCSDDFKPENREWFVKHIAQCAYNTLVQGQFYYPDWDMWWTDDSQAMKNSLLRAISGGPIYVSDTSDRSRKEILEPLTFEDGKILMCDSIGVPTRDCLLEEPTCNRKIFKLQNMANGCGILEAFNLNKDNLSVSGTVSPSDIEGLDGEEFAVYDYFSKTIQILKLEDKIEITLNDYDDCKLYIIVPLKNGNAVIGKTDKFISPKTYEFLDGEFKPLEKGEYAFVENNKLIFREY
ncbi:MAG: hypothetical protein IKT38_01935 [Clostridia bacterium]|nr:hypothetical protein [Clostridia bacterium]